VCVIAFVVLDLVFFQYCATRLASKNVSEMTVLYRVQRKTLTQSIKPTNRLNAEKEIQISGLDSSFLHCSDGGALLPLCQLSGASIINTTMNAQDEFRNVSVTEVGVADTRYGVSQPVASRRLSAGWLSCCYS